MVESLTTKTLAKSETISLSEILIHISEIVERGQSAHQRVILTRNGRPATEFMSPDELATIEDMMDRCAEFSVAPGIPVYFCDPHSPWQRGSNENTTGLLRHDLPKGTDQSKQSTEDLERIQRSLNGRPRETLQVKTPSEKLAEVIALTG